MDSPAITEEHAEELLRRDVNIAYRSVERLTAPYSEDLTDNQMGAFTSLCFNIGSGFGKLLRKRLLLEVF